MSHPAIQGQDSYGQYDVFYPDRMANDEYSLMPACIQEKKASQHCLSSTTSILVRSTFFSSVSTCNQLSFAVFVWPSLGAAWNNICDSLLFGGQSKMITKHFKMSYVHIGAIARMPIYLKNDACSLNSPCWSLKPVPQILPWCTYSTASISTSNSLPRKQLTILQLPS